MAIGHVQQRDISERRHVVKAAGVFAAGERRAVARAALVDQAGGGAHGEHLQEFTSGQAHISLIIL